MNIALVCGCAEPGRDGVGDYARMLGAGLEEAGCRCCLLALQDPYVHGPQEIETHSSASTVPVLRLPAELPWAQREEIARRCLAEFRPEWLSLQFVGRAWQSRGLVAGWGKRFNALAGPAARHIMFHEAWCGHFIGAPLQQKVLGSLQRFFTCRMVRRFHPQVIHTHTPAFRSMLAKDGIHATLLPLFGSIPLSTERDDAWLYSELQRQGTEITADNREGWWMGGFFGTLHPEWQSEPFFSTLHRAARSAERRVALITAGDTKADAHWQRLRQAYPNLHFANLGMLSPLRISHYLQALDFGVAATSWQLISKSSSAAAMLEHGLPVIVTRNDWRWRNGANPDPPAHPRLILAGPDLEQRLLRGLPRDEPCSRLPEVTAKLLADLAVA
jgi:hypothetical protein